MVWESHIGSGLQERPDFSLLSLVQLQKPIQHLQNKPCKHYRGWIGEAISHFVLEHFVATNRSLLDYAWEAIQPAKAEVTDGELDIVAAYELTNQKLGHICGEVKTYERLSAAKTKAYDDLQKARNWSHNRDAEVRGALNALLVSRYSVGALEAATLAMGDERSFLPSLIHAESTTLKNRPTFDDLPQRFDLCTRPSQLIGIQIAIEDFGGSCHPETQKNGFFEYFIQQMMTQANHWKNQGMVA